MVKTDLTLKQRVDLALSRFHRSTEQNLDPYVARTRFDPNPEEKLLYLAKLNRTDYFAIESEFGGLTARIIRKADDLPEDIARYARRMGFEISYSHEEINGIEASYASIKARIRDSKKVIASNGEMEGKYNRLIRLLDILDDTVDDRLLKTDNLGLPQSDKSAKQEHVKVHGNGTNPVEKKSSPLLTANLYIPSR